MSKVEPLKAGLRVSAAVDRVYGTEKCLCAQCLSFTSGARFWYMSSTASIDTYRRELTESELVFRPVVLERSIEGNNLNVSVNQLVGFKVIVVLAEWVDDQLAHLQIGSLFHDKNSTQTVFFFYKYKEKSENYEITQLILIHTQCG